MKSDRFHLEVRDGKPVAVKTSNGQIIPDDEPVVILRGRDHLALPLLRIYLEVSRVDGCTEWFINEQLKTIAQFEQFATEHADRMKQPGITMGR